MTVNNSGGPPVNSLADDDRFGLADLGRIRDQYNLEPAAIRGARLRGEEAQKRVSSLLQEASADPSLVESSEYKKSLFRNLRITKNVNSRLSVYQESKEDRLNEQAVNAVNREFSSSAVNSYVARHANTLEAQVAGASMTGQGYRALDAQREQIMNQMKDIRQASVSAASLYIGPGGVNANSASTLQSGSEQMKELAKQLIPITLAMQQLKQQGLDPKGRQEELARVGNKAAGVLHANQLQEDMRTGKGLGAFSPAELKKKEAEAAEKLIKALTALNTAAGKTTDELNELNKNAEEAAKEFKDINEAKEAKKDGGGGNKFDSIKMIAGTVQEMFEVGISAMHNLGIAQPMQMVANTAAAANMENEKYANWHAALAGNMHERMNLDWKDAQDFGNNLANNQDKIHTARKINFGIGGTIGLIQAGVGVASAVQGTTLGTNNPVENISQGGKSMMSGAAGYFVEASAQAYQTDMAALRIQGALNFQHAKKALSKISGEQLQGYRDYAMGINQTAGAMGGEVGETFLEETGGADFLEKLSAAGIGTKEFGILSQQGVRAMGSQFKKEQIFNAVQMEREGHGTAAENMQRMGILGAAGRGDSAADLSRIIEGAMVRGLNSSKALDMIVENTARISEESIVTGGTGEGSVDLAKLLMAAIDPNNANKDLGLKMAQDVQRSAEGARHNVATSLSGILNVDRNMKDLGIDRLSSTLMTKISTDELIRLGGLDEKSARLELETRGINTAGMSSAQFVDGQWAKTIRRNESISELAQQSGVGYAVGDPGAYLQELTNIKDKDARNAMIWGGKGLELLSDRQRELRRGVAASFGLNDRSSGLGISNAAVLAGVIDPESAEKAKKFFANRQNLVDEDRLHNRGESGRAAQGAKALGGDAGKAISALAESGRQAFEIMGKNAEATWGKAAQETAKNLGNSSTLMNGAAINLTAASKTMVDSTQLMAAKSASFSKAVEDAIGRITKDVQDMANAVEKMRNKKPEPTHIERRREEKRGAPRHGSLD